MLGRVELPVAWDLAARVGTRVAVGPGWSSSGSLLEEPDRRRLEDDFAAATERAEDLVEAATGLRASHGPARAEVVDRPAWVRANLVSFRHILESALAKLDRPQPSMLLGKLGADMAGRVAATELGALLGWFSTRVLGQYDLLFADGSDRGDLVSYVGPNILAVERRHGFPPEQFRLWIAIHEVTHRAQFTGVPWLRSYFTERVDRVVAAIAPDPGRALDIIARLAGSLRRGSPERPDLPGTAGPGTAGPGTAGPGISGYADGIGVIGVLLSPEQRVAFDEVQALMSLLEGHGDVTMDRAGSEVIPEAAWFSAVLSSRRRHPGMANRIIQQLTGMGAKMRQYEEGERFVRAVEEAGGPGLFSRVWDGPEWLPSMSEIRAPELWIGRALHADPVSR